MAAFADQAIEEICGPPNESTTLTETTKFAWLYVCITALSAFTSSIYLYLPSVIILKIKEEFKLDGLLLGAFFSCALFGAVGGAMAALPIADRIGRRPTLLLVQFLMILGTIISSIPSRPLFLLGRTLGGLGVGSSNLMTFIYASEIAPFKERSRILSVNCIFSNLGIVFALGIGLVPDWKAAFIIPAFLAILTSSLIYALVPETPRFLISRGRNDEAMAVLDKITRADDLVKRPLFNEACREPECNESWSDLKKKKYLKPLMKSLLVLSIPSISGYSSIYLIYFFYNLRLLNLYNSKIIGTVLYGVLLLLTTFIPWAIGNKVSKRHLILLISLAIYGLSMLICGIMSFPLYNKQNVPIIVVMVISFSSFQAGAHNLTKQIASEQLPREIKGRGVAFGFSSEYLIQAIITLILPIFVRVHLSAVFLTFGILSIIGLLSLIFIIEMPKIKLRSQVSKNSLELQNSLEKIEALHRLPVVNATGEGRDAIFDLDVQRDDEDELELITKFKDFRSVTVPSVPTTP